MLLPEEEPPLEEREMLLLGEREMLLLEGLQRKEPGRPLLEEREMLQLEGLQLEELARQQLKELEMLQREELEVRQRKQLLLRGLEMWLQEELEMWQLGGLQQEEAQLEGLWYSCTLFGQGAHHTALAALKRGVWSFQMESCGRGRPPVS